MENKAILMSIQPKWVAKILNGKKTIEVRKKFPKDYVGWVYIYCTKGKPNLWLPYEFDCFPLDEASQPYLGNEPIIDLDDKLNGKVVARFWCDKVEEIEHYPYEAPEHPRGYQIAYDTKSTNWDKLCGMSCLSRDELFDYLGRNNGYAIHISKLEVFNKPKEIGEFKSLNKCKGCSIEYCCNIQDICRLNKAPQSWQFIEGE